jgi:hypothetical protein
MAQNISVAASTVNAANINDAAKETLLLRVKDLGEAAHGDPGEPRVDLEALALCVGVKKGKAPKEIAQRIAKAIRAMDEEKLRATLDELPEHLRLVLGVTTGEVEVEVTQELPALVAEPVDGNPEAEEARLAEEKQRINAERDAVLAEERARREAAKAEEKSVEEAPVAEEVAVVERPRFGVAKVGEVEIKVTDSVMILTLSNGRRPTISPLAWSFVAPTMEWGLEAAKEVGLEALERMVVATRVQLVREEAVRQLRGRYGLNAFLSAPANLRKLTAAQQNTAQQKMAAVMAFVEGVLIFDEEKWGRAREHVLSLLEYAKIAGGDLKALERAATAWGINGFETRKASKPAKAVEPAKTQEAKKEAEPVVAPKKTEELKKEELTKVIAEFLGMEGEARTALLRETLRFCADGAGKAQKAAIYEAGKALVAVLDDESKRADAAKALIRALVAFEGGRKIVAEATRAPMEFFGAMQSVMTAKADDVQHKTANAVIPPEEGKKEEVMDNKVESTPIVPVAATIATAATGTPCNRCNSAPCAEGSVILCEGCLAEVATASAVEPSEKEEVSAEAGATEEGKEAKPSEEAKAPEEVKGVAEEAPKQGAWERVKTWCHGVIMACVDGISPEGKQAAEEYAALLQRATQGAENALVSENGAGQMVTDLRDIYTHAASAAHKAKGAFFTVKIDGEFVDLGSSAGKAKYPAVAARVSAQWTEVGGEYTTNYVADKLRGFNPDATARVHMLFEYFLGRKLVGNRFGMFTEGRKEFSAPFTAALDDSRKGVSGEVAEAFEKAVKLLKNKGDEGVRLLLSRVSRATCPTSQRAGIEAIFVAIDACMKSSKDDEIGALVKAAGAVVFKDEAGNHSLPGFGASSNLGAILTSAIYEVFSTRTLNTDEKLFIFAMKTPEKLETQVRMPGFRGWGHKVLWKLGVFGVASAITVVAFVDWVSAPIQAAVRALMAGGYLLAAKFSKENKEKYTELVEENLSKAKVALYSIVAYPVAAAIIGWVGAKNLFGRVKALLTRRSEKEFVPAKEAEPKEQGIVARIGAFFGVESLSTLPIGKEKGKAWADQTVVEKAITVVAAPVRIAVTLVKKAVEAAKAKPVVAAVAVAAVVGATILGGVVAGAAVAAVGFFGGMLFRRFFGSSAAGSVALS